MASAAAPDDGEPSALPHEHIFRDNAPAVPAQPRLHIDRKRMRELQELRIALGHQPDDHEEEQTQTQSWGGMTMKGW